MEKEKRELKGAGELRRKAQERLKEKPVSPEKLSELKNQELIQELQVHQIELEMQNEELRKTQAVLEESRAKYSDLYDFAPVGYLTLNRQGVILEVNLTACSSLGEERSLLVNIKNLFTKFIIKRGEKDLFYQHLKKVFEAKSLETCELELKGKGDTKFYAQLQSIVVKDNLSQCRTAITDITERKQAEQIIKDTAHQFQAVVESVGEGITFSDSSGKFSVYNLKMQKLTGYTVDEANNSGDFTRLLYPEPLERQKALQRLQEIVEHKVALPLEVETTIQAKDGTKKVLWISTMEMRFKDQQMFLSIYRDITERKRAEEELKKIDQLKSDFVSTVSHELRTPLAIIKEGVSLVLDGSVCPIREEQAKLLTPAKNNIDRLARLINNLLDISKLEAGKTEFKPVLVDFSTMLRETCAKWKIETDNNCQGFDCCLPDLPVNIYIDPDKLTQILDNLISNAIKFTPKEGKIKVELKDEKNQIEISISDTGIGIAKEDRPKVFGRFQQFSRPQGGAGYKGTGLGLAIVKELIEMHKGEIRVESELDAGTKFIFIIPKIKAEEIFKEYIINGLKEAADRKLSLSLIVVHIVEFSQLQEKWGEKPLYLLTDIERVIKDSLRRRADTVLKSTGELVIPLSDTRKEDAEVVKKRIEEAIRTYLSQCKEEWIKEIRITLGTATYPEEANNHQELLDKARTGEVLNTRG